MEPPERPFALLSTILANANRNAEETPEPFTVNDFIHWLTAPFEDVNDTEDEEDEDDAEWEETPEDDAPWPEEEPVPETDEEPAWMQWKRNIRAYGESIAPRTQPLPPPT